MTQQQNQVLELKFLAMQMISSSRFNIYVNLLWCVFHQINVVLCFFSLSSQIAVYSRGGGIRESSSNIEFDELRWPTPNGVDINIQCCKSRSISSREQPPILFLHGSFHSAWCYQEHFMPYFSSCGYDCFAMSLRGTKASALSKDIKSVRIEEHVGDVSFVVEQIRRESSQKPIIVAHSFGGLVLMKILERSEMRDAISAAVFLCSIPPSGNGEMTKRFLVRTPLLSLKIVWGFVFRGVTTNADLCRELFFDSQLDAELLAQYMAHFKEDSTVVVDFAALSSVLPSKTSMRADGSAAWLSATDAAEYGEMPARVVIGAGQDRIVDEEGLQETARYLGVQALQLPNLCHDVMLASEWRSAADLISKQLAKIR